MSQNTCTFAGTAAVVAFGICILSDQPAIASGEVHWGYSGATGPENWGRLSESFAVCDTGQAQSPFDIRHSLRAGLPDLAIDYAPTPLKVFNTGYTIQVPHEGQGSMMVNGVPFRLLQFHFHTPSEYTIEGKPFPLELHFVHASDAGDLAVIGVMFEEGEAHPEIAKIWDHMPTTRGGNAPAGVTIDAAALLPEDRAYYRFMGSLTTPPCAEGVNWHIMANPVSASTEQINAFKSLFPLNARPLQPANNRLIVIDE